MGIGEDNEKSDRCGHLQPHSRSPEATGHPTSKGLKQEVEVETQAWAPSPNPALPHLQPALAVLCVCGWQGEGAGNRFVTFCALHWQPLTFDLSIEVKYLSFGVGDLCENLSLAG